MPRRVWRPPTEVEKLLAHHNTYFPTPPPRPPLPEIQFSGTTPEEQATIYDYLRRIQPAPLPKSLIFLQPDAFERARSVYGLENRTRGAFTHLPSLRTYMLYDVLRNRRLMEDLMKHEVGHIANGPSERDTERFAEELANRGRVRRR